MLKLNMVRIIGILLTFIDFYTSVITDRIYLEKLSTVYLPHTYTDGEGEYRYDSGAAEQSAFDSQHHTVYIVGGNVLHVIDIKNISAPTIVYHQQFGNVDLTDVEFCGDHLFLAVDDNDDKENGKVNVYRKYNSTTGTLDIVHTITVGSLPDMIHPTSDCSIVVVAIEAEAYNNGTDFKDPEGAVGLIKFTTNRGAEGTYQYTKLNFTKFNDKWQDLTSRGARYVYRRNNNPFSNDLEPEYIAFNKPETVAYIGLQENNAIAEVDIINENITAIHPLGFKNWTQWKFDASDKDNGINISSWPVMGIYQPDSIKVINVGEETFIVTANEGDAKDYSKMPGSGGFDETSRVKSLSIDSNSYVGQWAMQNGYSASLLEDENLGRLKVSNVDGSVNGTHHTLYAYGGRSISIFDTNTFTQVYDSGSELEEKIAQWQEDFFNANGAADNDVIFTVRDTRSDDKGPETESLAVAHIGDRVIIFAGLERPGFIAIYSITGSDVTSIKFESLWSGIPNSNTTYTDLYERRKISEVDPEDLRYIPTEHSPNNRPVLLVTGTVSGTLSVFEIKGLCDTCGDISEDDTSLNSGNVSFHWTVCVISYPITLILIHLISKRTDY